MLARLTAGFRPLLAAAGVAAVALPAPASACRIYVRPVLEDVRLADVVVVGRIEHYRVVRDEAFRRRMLKSPRLSAELRSIYADPHKSLMPDYVRFDVRVEEVLLGRASRRLSVTWDNSTFGEPESMPPGPYLIALRRPTSPMPPLRGPSAAIMPAPDPRALTLLQAPCSSAFVYEAGSEEARRIRAILAAAPAQKPPRR